MYPVLLPPAPVSPAVRAAEAALLARDGMFHVGETYFADANCAAVQRRWVAEGLVRTAARVEARRLANECAFCHEVLTARDQIVQLAGDRLHRICANEWDDWANGPTDAEIAEMLYGIDAPREAA